MTIKILPSEKETLKKLCAQFDLECWFHEQELKSEVTGLELEYFHATVEGLTSFTHVWHFCRAFSLEIEVADLKKKS